jgi:hypothetical protein
VKPNVESGVVAYVDSDYAGDKENRRSITGYLIYPYDVREQQGGVTLSSSEAEYNAIREVATELKFLRMILDILEIDTGGLMKVFVDNIGAIHPANNASSGMRTKHIDSRIHYVRDLPQGDDKILEIEYVRSEENKSDTFSKNNTNEVFRKHKSRYMKEDG